MKFYSTNSPSLKVDLRQAVTQGLAPDNGLYMPEAIPKLEDSFYRSIERKSLQEIGITVATAMVGDAVPADELARIVKHTIQFDAPVVEIEDNVYAMELFHGPTLAFKDFGARFMSQLLGYFAKEQKQEIVILVATSGDTGSAVANGFLGIAGTRVVVLYPSGKVSEIQEKQFTTLGQNITALEIDGTFDDCQKLVKESFLDDTLRGKLFLTSANSINIARLIPQSFYYFYGYAQLKQKNRPVSFCVPSGNFGNLTGGLLAKRMGLPIGRFIAATNSNDVVPEFLKTRQYTPRPSMSTISNAMDVGNPSNVARILDLFHGDIDAIRAEIESYSFTDEETRQAMRKIYNERKYVMDPHGAVGYLGLKKFMRDSGPVSGVFLETAHPAKFKDVVDETLGINLEIPVPLQKFMRSEKTTIRMGKEFQELKDLLLSAF
ncbi:MAG: threonine synthase [Chryseolinea sp.]